MTAPLSGSQTASNRVLIPSLFFTSCQKPSLLIQSPIVWQKHTRCLCKCLSSYLLAVGGPGLEHVVQPVDRIIVMAESYLNDGFFHDYCISPQSLSSFPQAGAIGVQDQIWVWDWLVSQVRSAGIFPCNHVRAHLLPQVGEWPDSGPDKVQ